MHNSLLQHLADIQVGYSFRARLEASPAGVPAVQMRDLRDDGTVDCRSLLRVSLDEAKKNHQLRRGDLVFRSRGQDLRSALMVDEPKEPTVLVAPLYRVRILPSEPVLPEFLNWYLHQDTAQAYFASRVKGTAQKMISKHSLANLPLSVPPLEVQQAIVEIAALANRETTLLKTLAAKRQAVITSQLMQLAETR